MRVAILHYWFLNSGGGEKVIEALANIYPQADYYVLFADPNSIPSNIPQDRVKRSFLDRIPFSRKLNRLIFPLFPMAVESFDLSNYDLVISSDSPPMKGVILKPSTTHICYCHTPGRYLWDYFCEYRSTLPIAVRPVYSASTQYVRSWDFQAAQRVDVFAANSQYVAKRIWKYYRRPSTVIYPPISTSNGYISSTIDDYYLSAGRLVENKRLDLLIHACNQLNRKLVIAGAGRAEKQLRSIAGPTIEFLGRVTDEQLARLYSRCRAFLFAAEEDFGIVPVEAQSYGRPIIALGKGGSLETILGHGNHPEPTGLFFYEQKVCAVKAAVLQFERIEHEFQPSAIRKHACKFDASVFESRMKLLVDDALRANGSHPSEVPRQALIEKSTLEKSVDLESTVPVLTEGTAA